MFDLRQTHGGVEGLGENWYGSGPRAQSNTVPARMHLSLQMYIKLPCKGLAQGGAQHISADFIPELGV